MNWYDTNAANNGCCVDMDDGGDAQHQTMSMMKVTMMMMMAIMRLRAMMMWPVVAVMMEMMIMQMN